MMRREKPGHLHCSKPTLSVYNQQLDLFRRSAAIALVVVALAGAGCDNIPKNATHSSIPDASIRQGKELAARYCQSCHLLPDPSLLNAASWEKGVLPAMAPRLGIFTHNGQYYASAKNDPDLSRNFYPSKPVITAEEWQSIIDYYSAVSPDSLQATVAPPAVRSNLPLFETRTPANRADVPITTFVQFDTLDGRTSIFTGDMNSRRVYRYNAQLQPVDSLTSLSPVVQIDRHAGGFLACNIGVMNPNNGHYGTLTSVIAPVNGPMTADTSVRIYGLSRPVQVTAADFNKDGITDYLVCEFGHMEGELSWMEGKGHHQFTKHVLRPLPGAIKAYIRDVNKDGLPDIWVLFAQGDEGIFLFTNKGNGAFDQDQKLRFPPVYGSSGFELVDFNGDGFEDILYTCGDNADYSAVLKPYHGLYLYLNDGHNQFTKAFFYPMFGCYKAIAADFDGDGDKDIAAISFFADYLRHPEQSFIYLDNRGEMHFEPWTIPGTDAGRWLSMDAGDINRDGKTDLILGNFSMAPSAIPAAAKWQQGPPFLLLLNTGKKP